MPNVDAQAEEEELPPNPSAEIPMAMADPVTVHCDDDVEVKFFILILTFQLHLILSKIVDLLFFFICADTKRLSLHVD